MQLPGIRNLSLAHMPSPALEPLEPCADNNPSPHQQATPYMRSQNNSGLRISEILSQQDGTHRKLPVPQAPKMAVQDMLNGNGNNGFNSSGDSSAAASVSGGDFMDRY